MAIVTLKPFTLNPRDELFAEIVGLIDAASNSDQPVSQVDLTKQIMIAVDQSAYVREV